MYCELVYPHTWRVKQRNERVVEFLIPNPIQDPLSWGLWAIWVQGVGGGTLWCTWFPGTQFQEVCLGYQVSPRITAPSRSKKYWLWCKYAGPKRRQPLWIRFCYPDISEPKATIHHGKYHILSWIHTAWPQEKNLQVCDINMFSSANKLLYSPAAKNFKCLLNKDSPTKNNDVKPKP